MLPLIQYVQLSNSMCAVVDQLQAIKLNVDCGSVHKLGSFGFAMLLKTVQDKKVGPVQKNSQSCHMTQWNTV